MDFEAQRKKRMEDLALKRKRLEEMRKQRAEKNATPEVTAEVSTPPPPPTEVTPPPDTTSVDDLVNSLLSSDNDPPPVTTETTDSSTSNVAPVAPPPALSRLEQTRLRAAEWTTCQNVCSFTVLPVVPEVYEKGIQTEAATEARSEDSDTDGNTTIQEAHSYHRSPQRPRQRSRGDSAVEEDTPVKPNTVTGSAPPTAASLTPEDISNIVVCVFVSFIPVT